MIGAGRDPVGLGNRVVANLLAGGFKGPVFPVNERADHVNSVLAYHSLAEVPTRVDLAVLAVPADRLDEAVEQCARHGVGGMVVTTAGVDGAALASRARRLGMRVVGPASLGMINDDPALSLWALVGPPPSELVAPAGPGRLGRQPGGPGRAVLGRGGGRARPGRPGRPAPLRLRQPRPQGRRQRQRPPPVLGRRSDAPGWCCSTWSPTATPAASSASPDGSADTSRSWPCPPPAGRKGPEPWAAGRTCSPPCWPRPEWWRRQRWASCSTWAACWPVSRCRPGRRLAVVSNNGSPATLAAAAARRCGLEVVDEVELDETAGPLDFQEALTLVLGRAGIDAVAVLYAPLYLQDLDLVAEAIATSASRAGRTVVATYLGRAQPPPSSVPAYRFPEEGVRALALAARYGAWRATHSSEAAAAPDAEADEAVARVRELVAAVLAEEPAGKVLAGADGARLLAAAGVPVAGQRWVSSVEEAVAAADEVGWPIALKAGERPAVARTESTGLALDIDDATELRGAWGRMTVALGAAGPRPSAGAGHGTARHRRSAPGPGRSPSRPGGGAGPRRGGRQPSRRPRRPPGAPRSRRRRPAGRRLTPAGRGPARTRPHRARSPWPSGSAGWRPSCPHWPRSASTRCWSATPARWSPICTSGSPRRHRPRCPRSAGWTEGGPTAARRPPPTRCVVWPAMRAVVLEEYGGPEVLQVKEVPGPDARSGGGAGRHRGQRAQPGRPAATPGSLPLPAHAGRSRRHRHPGPRVLRAGGGGGRAGAAVVAGRRRYGGDRRGLLRRADGRPRAPAPGRAEHRRRGRLRPPSPRCGSPPGTRWSRRAA